MTNEDIKTINDIVHKTIYGFFDSCGDNKEVPMTDKDKLLLEVNKAICNNIKALEQEPCKDCISRAELIDKTIKRNSIWLKITDSRGMNLQEIIDELQSVTPTRKHGKWNYCPNCGTMMEESEEE